VTRSDMRAFDGVKVFCATMIQQRQTLGEQVTAWIEDAGRQRPGFKVVDIVVRQSSDAAFHCISICVFYNEALAVAKAPQEKPHRG
jgi:hypothetical protein